MIQEWSRERRRVRREERKRREMRGGDVKRRKLHEAEHTKFLDLHVQ